MCDLYQFTDICGRIHIDSAGVAILLEVHTLKRLNGESLSQYLEREEQELLEIAAKRRMEYEELGKLNSLQTEREWRQGYAWSAAHLIISQNHRCYWCCSLLTNKPYHIDHILPRKRGGSDDISNLRLSCRSCNLRKSAKLPMDFALSLLS